MCMGLEAVPALQASSAPRGNPVQTLLSPATSLQCAANIDFMDG